MELNPKNNTLPLSASDSNDHQRRQYSEPRVVAVKFKVEVGVDGSLGKVKTATGNDKWKLDNGDGTETWTTNGNFF